MDGVGMNLIGGDYLHKLGKVLMRNAHECFFVWSQGSSECRSREACL